MDDKIKEYSIMQAFTQGLEKAAERYKKFREECGISDPIMLDEIEEAFYEGGDWAAQQIYNSIKVMVENNPNL